MLNRLFENLVKRRCNENDLSDVTWALAETCPAFLEVFVKYFEFDTDGKLSIEREHILDPNNHPDFCITAGDKKFIIESKLSDTDYHVKAYSSFREIQNIAGFGLIVNHTIDDDKSEILLKREDWKVKYWAKFKGRLKEELNGNRFDTEEKPLVKAYINFIKGVCGIMEIKKMVFDNLVSLYHFNKLIGNIISDFEHEKKDFIYQKYNSGKPYSENCSGVYFCIQRKKTKSEVYPWLGIYFWGKASVSFDFGFL